MRGAFLIVTLIALLIVGLLVVKNMTTDVDEGVQKMDTVQKTKRTVKEVDDQTKDLQDRLKQATRGLEDTR
jgi:uncharacterized protein YxeA